MSVRAVFDATAATYDQARSRLIPAFDQLYSAAVDLLSTDTDHVLDLGCGTGLLAAHIRHRFPDARLHLIDNSEPMLAQASARFAHDQEVLCQLGDYTAAQWGASYDAVVSALSIHHLGDSAKQALFRRITPALKPGGVFINLEQVLAPSAALEQAAREQWLRDVSALGATEQQIADSLFRQTEDRCATAADQLAWMQAAGLIDCRCMFSAGRFAVLTGTRPS